MSSIDSSELHESKEDKSKKEKTPTPRRAKDLLGDMKDQIATLLPILEQIMLEKKGSNNETIFQALRDADLESGSEKNVTRRAALFFLYRIGEIIKYFNPDAKPDKPGAKKKNPIVTSKESLVIKKLIYDDGKFIAFLRNEIIHHFRYIEALARLNSGENIGDVLKKITTLFGKEEKDIFFSTKYYIGDLITILKKINEIEVKPEEDFDCEYLPGTFKGVDYFISAGLNFRALRVEILCREVIGLNKQLEQDPLTDVNKQRAALIHFLHICNLVKDLTEELQIKQEQVEKLPTWLSLIVNPDDLKGIGKQGKLVSIFEVFKQLIRKLDHGSIDIEDKELYEQVVVPNRRNNNINKLLRVITAIIHCEKHIHSLCGGVYQHSSSSFSSSSGSGSSSSSQSSNSSVSSSSVAHTSTAFIASTLNIPMSTSLPSALTTPLASTSPPLSSSSSTSFTTSEDEQRAASFVLERQRKENKRSVATAEATKKEPSKKKPSKAKKKPKKIKGKK